MSKDNMNFYEMISANTAKKIFDSEGQQIIGGLLDSIAYSLASIADALDEINEREADK